MLVSQVRTLLSNQTWSSSSLIVTTTVLALR